MGYETTIYLVECSGAQKEMKTDEHGHFVKDGDGQIVYTGRDEVFMMKRAMVEMFKIYDTALFDLRQEYVDRFKAADKVAITRTTYMWYHSDGNTPCRSDRYDDPLVPIPADKVLKAARKDLASDPDPWYPIAMLVAMLEQLEKMKLLKNHHVVFYGH